MIKHTPVMVDEVIDAMPSSCDFVLDGTLGHGGHMQAMIDHCRDSEEQMPQFVGVDRDPAMLKKATELLEADAQHITVVQTSYANLEQISEESGVDAFDFILLDLGVNLEHFKDPARGFSIKLEGELDMRYDTTHGDTAKDWLRKTNFPELTDLLEAETDFSQKYRERFARELLDQRDRTGFMTTKDLQDRAAERGISDKQLAVFFQALRIAVNNELDQLENFLQKFPEWLLPGGRCVIISYHSGEDRRVKYALRDHDDAGRGTVLTKSVIKPDRKEIKRNKAARSAKMRIYECP